MIPLMHLIRIAGRKSKVANSKNSSWQQKKFHRDWLFAQAAELMDFFDHTTIDPKGGFFDLGRDGDIIEGPRQLHATTRMVHCHTVGYLLGRPGSADLIDHGMNFLKTGHRDQVNGGYFWALKDGTPSDDTKQAYGHAFVLLAASSAKLAGHPLADEILSDVSAVLEERFWEEGPGAVSEEYAADWSKISDYRGQNSNMHLTEALMAAFEATGEQVYLNKAKRIAELIIGKHAVALDYRVAEHFHEDWSLDNDYKGNEMFRPSGSTPGHWLEWARLCLQLWALDGKQADWLKDAAIELFRQSIELGWDKTHGGFFYTLDWGNNPAMREKLWWPVCEAIGAAAFLNAHAPDPFHETWYRLLWDFAATHLLDREFGGWHPELSETLAPTSRLFTGKPDIYHALQACLIPLYPAEGSLTSMIAEA
jgi:mannose/cellobiose epimerase-like protein (N-acyl-D-glucosamine 2-epimerase family)